MEDYVCLFFPETGMLSRTNTEQMCHFFQLSNWLICCGFMLLFQCSSPQKCQLKQLLSW